ncbi:hypothetical protein ACFP2F_20345 [Hymenobacter artigasi]|uniref:Uncharacterized protein n=1 Tax=Hymenobacter artigasi TaxID=2719616 RepID=A0ABX1HMN4_9BACT|nr:hypothetical protein [Hymenobacter artigasi]NKI91518.1 hypothetical protein [Hymenobacter artigasi]
MLTVAKLAVLIKYRWDYRRFNKNGLPEEKALLADLDLHALAELLQDLTLYHKKLVSDEYAVKIHATLRTLCADDETAQTLLGYASTL